MEHDVLPVLRREQEQRLTEVLLATNSYTGHYGIELTRRQAMALARHQSETLRDSLRVGLGTGILPKLIYHFCDSPYIDPKNFTDLLYELQEAFYHFKNQSFERLDDDDLLVLMKNWFDGPCEGSVEYLTGTLLEDLCRGLRSGEGISLGLMPGCEEEKS